METIAEGTRVRFTDGPLGLMHDEDTYKFAEPVARAGDFGTYLHPHSTLEDWHIVKVIVPEVSHDLYAPVHRGQFETQPA